MGQFHDEDRRAWDLSLHLVEQGGELLCAACFANPLPSSALTGLDHDGIANLGCYLHGGRGRGGGGKWEWEEEGVDESEWVGGDKVHMQRDLSIEDTLNKGHFSNEDTVHSPDHIELCTNLPLN